MSSVYWKNRLIVVTGGGRGQGAAEVRRLLAEGAHVFCVDIIDATHPDWALGEYASEPRLMTLTANVAEPETWQMVKKQIAESGCTLGGLVNNAGITLRKTVSVTSYEEWRRVLAVNLDAAFLAINALSSMMPPGSSIVNISSTAGMTGYFAAAYTTSKWALRGLSKAAAIELSEREVRVNTICPGLVDTPMINKPNAGLGANAATGFFEGNRSMTPLGRGAQPEEIAAAVLFLLGPDSSFVTGTELVVDGGMIGGGIYTRIGRDIGLLGSPM